MTAGAVGMTLVAVGLLAGCGQKGPLTLPTQAAATASAAAPSPTPPTSAASAP